MFSVIVGTYVKWNYLFLKVIIYPCVIVSIPTHCKWAEHPKLNIPFTSGGGYSLETAGFRFSQHAFWKYSLKFEKTRPTLTFLMPTCEFLNFRARRILTFIVKNNKICFIILMWSVTATHTRRFIRLEKSSRNAKGTKNEFGASSQFGLLERKTQVWHPLRSECALLRFYCLWFSTKYFNYAWNIDVVEWNSIMTMTTTKGANETLQIVYDIHCQDQQYWKLETILKIAMCKIQSMNKKTKAFASDYMIYTASSTLHDH